MSPLKGSMRGPEHYLFDTYSVRRTAITVLENNNNSNIIYNSNNNNNNVYGAVIMAEPLREFTRFI